MTEPPAPGEREPVPGTDLDELLMSDGARPRRISGTKLVVLQFALSGAVLLAVVATIGVVALGRAAKTEALRDAATLAEAVGHGVIQSGLSSELMAGDPEALEQFDELVRARVLSGPIVRVKIWTETGRIVYSDEPRLVGRSFTVKPDLARVFADGRVHTELSDLEGAENTFERPLGRLVEVYLPLVAPNGRALVAETYQNADRIDSGRSRIFRTFVPVLLAALLALAAAQVPLGIWLSRRIRDYWRERDALAAAAHEATDEERRRIAHDLHDGVVQDLAGTAFELASTADHLQARSRTDVERVLRRGAAVSRESMAVLRSLLVDLYEPERSGSLADAVQELARPLEARGIEVHVKAVIDAPLDVTTEELLYRAAREVLRNVLRHAGAAKVDVTLRTSGGWAELEVADDGVGMSGAELAERRSAGHLGLALLAERVHARGGAVSISSQPGRGTRLTLSLPLEAAGAAE